MNGIDTAVKAAFENLANRLSPENLACDGEISQAEVKRRYKQIMVEWKALEAKVGRKVTEDEVMAWELAEYEASRKREGK